MSVRPVLNRVGSPSDLRRLDRELLPTLTRELREEIIESVSKTGGHLASGLGSVELTTGIHYVFDTPNDMLVLDVGHQGYPHKLLTGRRSQFSTIGKPDGIGKFLRRAESHYDPFGAGHAGTSISAALGMAWAAERSERSDRIAIALIGDASLGAGMAFEAMNHAGGCRQQNLLVVLNDNGMSMSPTVGALSRELGVSRRRLASDPPGPNPADGDLPVARAFFEALGFSYLGPIDGNDVLATVAGLEQARERLAEGRGPVLVHALTAKGFGYEAAERDPQRYHGVTPFSIETGDMKASSGGPPSYTKVFASSLTKLAVTDSRIVAITAAMSDGTGVELFKQEHPDRYIDVGIAEQHAVTLAAGLATEGLKPVVTIYSTFLQRGFDQIVHDVSIQNLDVTFAMDRAGLVGADGATHQGSYDLTYLRCLPNLVVMAPKDENELQHLLRTAIEYPGPAAIRYPRGAGIGIPLDGEAKCLPIGEAELLREGDDVAILALGTRVAPAIEAAEQLAARGISASVLNARFAKPLDRDKVVALARRCGAVLTVEEHTGAGGFGAAILETLAAAGVHATTRCLALPDQIIEQGNADDILAEFGLDAAGIALAAYKLAANRAAA